MDATLAHRSSPYMVQPSEQDRSPVSQFVIDFSIVAAMACSLFGAGLVVDAKRDQIPGEQAERAFARCAGDDRDGDSIAPCLRAQLPHMTDEQIVIALAQSMSGTYQVSTAPVLVPVVR